MKKCVLGSLLFITSLFAIPEENNSPSIQTIHKSPANIQKELDSAEKQFSNALTLFNPWYSGPIVAGSANMMPPGTINVQGYLFAIDHYASFNAEKNSIHDPNPLWQVQQQLVAQTGITSWMDIAIAPALTTNFKDGSSYTGVTDIPITLGLKIMSQGVWVPAIKVAIGQTFPNGKYDGLSARKNGTDSTGGGSWVTSFSLRFGKLLFWWTHHPLNTRLLLQYSVPTTVHVSGINSYGGGIGARGKVRSGNSMIADLGLEWSLTQKWALATDIIYTVSGRTTFNGFPGTDRETGELSSVGGGSSYSFQLAPAVEYNWNESLAAIAGIWFTPYGRNTSNFINYTISVTYTFNP